MWLTPTSGARAASLGAVVQGLASLGATQTLVQGPRGMSVRLTKPIDSVFSWGTLLVSALCLGLGLSMGAAMWALRRDATILAQAREEVAASEEQFRALAEQAPLAIVLCDNGTVAYANAEGHRRREEGQHDARIPRLERLAHKERLGQRAETYAHTKKEAPHRH